LAAEALPPPEVLSKGLGGLRGIGHRLGADEIEAPRGELQTIGEFHQGGITGGLVPELL